MKKTFVLSTRIKILEVSFSIILLCFLAYEYVFKSVHLFRGFYAVIPHDIAVEVYFAGLTLICLRIIIRYYNLKTEVKNKPPFKKTHTHKLKTRVSIILIICIVLAMFFTNYTSINYIDEKGIYNDGSYIEFEDVKKISISIEKDLFSYPGTALFHNYNIRCKINTNRDELIVYSNDFYSYKQLYFFLSRFNQTIIQKDDTLLKELVLYEKNLLFNITFGIDNVYYIDKIFKTG